MLQLRSNFIATSILCHTGEIIQVLKVHNFLGLPTLSSLNPGPTATTVPSRTFPWPFSGRSTPPLVFYRWQKIKNKDNGKVQSRNSVSIHLENKNSKREYGCQWQYEVEVRLLQKGGGWGLQGARDKVLMESWMKFWEGSFLLTDILTTKVNAIFRVKWWNVSLQNQLFSGLCSSRS